MCFLIPVYFIEYIVIYTTILMGRDTIYDKYLLCFKVEFHPLRFFVVLQFSKHQRSGYLVEFVDYLTDFVNNISLSS